MEAALEDRLRLEPYVLSTPQELATALRASTSDFQATTSLIAAIALFAGAFLVFNTLSMTVVEQVREVGLLRAAGATRRQVIRFMLSQAAAIGVLGSLVGVGLGALLAAAMVAYVRTIGSVTLQRPAIPVDGIAIAFLVGLGVTIAAALEPARRAARIQPVEALKARLDLPAARRARLRWLAAVFVLVALVGLLVAPRGAGVVQSLAVYAIMLGATLLIPVVLPVVARIAGIPFALVLRFEERLARASVVRDPSRMALTLGALTIALGMIVALGGVGQHARAAAGAWIADVIPGELLLTSIRPVGADEAFDIELQTTVPSIARISPLATFDIALERGPDGAAAIVGGDLAADGRLASAAGEQGFGPGGDRRRRGDDRAGQRGRAAGPRPERGPDGPDRERRGARSFRVPSASWSARCPARVANPSWSAGPTRRRWGGRRRRLGPLRAGCAGERPRHAAGHGHDLRARTSSASTGSGARSTTPSDGSSACSTRSRRSPS